MKVFIASKESISSTYLWTWFHTEDKHVHRLRWDSLYYSPSNMNHTANEHAYLSLATNVLYTGDTLLTLGSSTFDVGDEHFSDRDERIENACLSFSHTHTHTHTASYQRLPSSIYVEIIALVTATYLQNGHYHIERIQKVSRLTTVSSVALNWSSRPSKERKL